MFSDIFIYIISLSHYISLSLSFEIYIWEGKAIKDTYKALMVEGRRDDDSFSE